MSTSNNAKDNGHSPNPTRPDPVERQESTASFMTAIGIEIDPASSPSPSSSPAPASDPSASAPSLGHDLGLPLPRPIPMSRQGSMGVPRSIPEDSAVIDSGSIVDSGSSLPATDAAPLHTSAQGNKDLPKSTTSPSRSRSRSSSTSASHATHVQHQHHPHHHGHHHSTQREHIMGVPEKERGGVGMGTGTSTVIGRARSSRSGSVSTSTTTNTNNTGGGGSYENDKEEDRAYRAAEKEKENERERERGAGLKTWWKSFTGGQQSNQSSSQGQGQGYSQSYEQQGEGANRGKDTSPSSVFASPLEKSLSYASVQISTAGPDGTLYVWGYVPVVVAKCGLYLKENATEVPGIFRISGSTKRMKELQAVFEDAPKYGKNLDWKSTPYMPHDVATILRRYLTQMPEPIIPLELYHEFRDALDKPNPNPEEVIPVYKSLIGRMPKPNQYLLLYVLDLLSVFAKKSDQNLMTSSNLAVIFQPGIISHPNDEMSPEAHALSQSVLGFLIEHQDHFLLGMQLEPIKSRGSGNSSSTNPSASSPSSTSRPPLLAPPDVGGGPTSSSSSVASSNQSSLTPNANPTITRPTPPVRADTDLMALSDSDEEAPEGGYYVHEVDPRQYQSELLRSKSNNSRTSVERELQSQQQQLSPPTTGGPSGGFLFRKRSASKSSDQPQALPAKITIVDNPPLQGKEPSEKMSGAGGLFRRRTTPSKRPEPMRPKQKREVVVTGESTDVGAGDGSAIGDGKLGKKAAEAP